MGLAGLQVAGKCHMSIGRGGEGYETICERFVQTQHSSEKGQDRDAVCGALRPCGSFDDDCSCCAHCLICVFKGDPSFL